MVQRLLTFGRLCHILENRLQCTKLRLIPPGELHDTDGTPTPAVYAFVRIVEGVQFEVILDVYDENQPVMEDTLRYVRDRLKITDEADLSDGH